MWTASPRALLCTDVPLSAPSRACAALDGTRGALCYTDLSDVDVRTNVHCTRVFRSPRSFKVEHGYAVSQWQK